MEFYAYLHQSGGCDYTIGCGNLLIILKAQNLQEAKIDLKKRIGEDFWGERRIESAIIISGESSKIDVGSIYDSLELEASQEEEREKKEKERAIYNRLKRKY